MATGNLQQSLGKSQDTEPSPLRKAATAYAEAEIEKQKANPHRGQWSQLAFVNAFMAGALWAVRQGRLTDEQR